MTRIAVVEDDVDVSNFMREVLQDSGHEVVSYLQPNSDTLQHLKAYRPELVILDLAFGGQISGWDIVEAMKSDVELEHVPVIMCTGATGQIAQHRSWLDAHDVRILPKPFDIAQLDSIVDRALVS